MFATESLTSPASHAGSSDARPMKAGQERAASGGLWKMMLETSEVAVRLHYARPWLRDAGVTRSR